MERTDFKVLCQVGNTKKDLTDKDFLSSLGERIVLARKDAGLIQPDLAETLEVDVKTISRYENGHTVPDIIVLRKIARATGKSFAWLVTGEEKPDPEDRSRAIAKRLKGQAGAASVDPGKVPAVEAAKILAGYFYFGERRIRTEIVFSSDGPPGDLGGYSPD